MKEEIAVPESADVVLLTDYDKVNLSNLNRVLAESLRVINRTQYTAENYKRFARISKALAQSQIKKIETAPGYGLHRFLASICPKTFRERELDALHADAIALYLERLDEDDKWGAWRVKWSMRGWMLWTVFGGALTAVMAMVLGKRKSSK